MTSATQSYEWFDVDDDEYDKKEEFALGQFIVQYDVDRSKSSEILVIKN